jgi:hypothetical protein
MMTMFNQGQNAAGDYMNYMGQANDLEINAGLNDVNAKSAIENGDYVAKRLEEKGRMFIGSVRGGYAKAGVRLEGSPLETLAYSERNIRMDIVMTRLNAAQTANQYGFQALQQRIAAGNAKTAAIAAAGRGLTSMVGTYATAGK